MWQIDVEIYKQESDDHWECELSREDHDRVGGSRSKDIVVEGGAPDGTDIDSYLMGRFAESGGSYLSLHNAVISDDKVTFPSKEEIWFTSAEISTRHVSVGEGDNGSSAYRGRKLVANKGELNTVVVRVVAKDAAAPEATQLNDDIFSDSYCLKSQYAECSYNKLTIKEYEPGQGISNVPTVSNAKGIVDVPIDINVVGIEKKIVETEATNAAETLFGVGDLGSLFDLVIYVSWLLGLVAR